MMTPSSNHNDKETTSRLQYQLIEQNIQLDQTTSGTPLLFMKYQVLHSWTNQVISMKQWAETLVTDYDAFNTVLSSCSFDAFFWECVPTTDGSNRMEFVLVNAPALAQFARTAPDRMAFREHFNFSDNKPFVAVFPSLGNDALLLAPNPQSSLPFTDIAYFARHASTVQQRDLYQRLSQVFLEQIGTGTGTKDDTHEKKKPIWLSTSGMGIAWMHIRFDSRPKYYTYTPYKSVAA